MRAVQINIYGGPEALEVKEIPTPETKESFVLVDVKAVGLNPFDKIILSGTYKERIPVTFPATFGGDFSGIIRETGEEVYGTAIVLSGGSGALAEVASVNPEKIAPKPTNVSFEEAASLPVAGVTAFQAIEENLKLSAGQKILIHGGAGGVGHLAIQLAKSIGAYVATTVSAEDIDFVRSLGADKVIDYKSKKFEEEINDFDAVFDLVGGEITLRSFPVLRESGTLVSMVERDVSELAKNYKIKVLYQASQVDKVHLLRLKEIVEGGKIKPHLGKVFAFGEVKEAVGFLASGNLQGKVVVRI